MNNNISTNNNSSMQVNPNNDPLRKYNKLYVILSAIIGIVLFLESFNPVGAIIGILIGLGVSWLIISAVAMFKTMKLNFTKYPLPVNITQKQLLDSLVKNFASSDIKIDKGFLGININYKNVTLHKIELNEDKKCYSISSTMSFKSKAKNGIQINSIKLYKYTIQTLPIIKDMIEKAALSHNS
jgi:hypothetical protein